MERTCYAILVEERSKLANLLELASELARRPENDVRLLMARRFDTGKFRSEVTDDRIRLYSQRPNSPDYAAPRRAARLRGLFLLGRLLIDRTGSPANPGVREPLPLFVARLLLASMQDFLRAPGEFLGRAAAFRRSLVEVLRQAYYCCCLHLEWAPSCVVFQHEGVRTIGRVWTRIGALGRVKTCMVTSAYSIPRKQIRLLGADPGCRIDTAVRRVVSERFPRWCVDRDGTSQLVAQAPDVLAAEIAGLALARPFVPNTGIADLVIVDSPFMVKQLAASNCDRHVVAVGSLGDDRLYRSQQDSAKNRRDIEDKYALDRGRRLVVASLPKNYFHVAPIPEFRTYEDLLDFWCRSFANLKGFSVLLSPHPHLKGRTSDVFERYPALRVADDWIADLIPVCDLFVAPMSTTIKWARQCGKPVVNYDCYQFGDFEGRGILAAYGTKEFTAALGRCADPSAFQALSDEAGRPDPDWPALDGKTLERIARTMAERLDLTGARRGRC